MSGCIMYMCEDYVCVCEKEREREREEESEHVWYMHVPVCVRVVCGHEIIFAYHM